MIVLLALVAIVAVASFGIGRIDTDFLRPRIEAAFGRATGRTLRIDGHLRLALLPAPGFVASDVSVSNLDGGSDPIMLRARSVEASLDLVALLGRHVHVESLVIDRPELLLEIVHGVPNWRFTPDRPVTAPSPPVAGGHRRTGFRIDTVDAEGGRIRWHRLQHLGSGAVAIDILHAQQQPGGDTLTYSVGGHHGAARFTISAAVGLPILADGDTRGPIPLRTLLTLGDERRNHLRLDGTLTRTGDVTSFDGRAHGVLAQLTELDALFPHASLPPAANLRLDAAIGHDQAGRWLIRTGTASADQVDLGRLRPGLEAAHLAVAIPGLGTDLGTTPGTAPGTTPGTVDATGSLGTEPFTIKGLAGTVQFWSEQASATPIDLAATLGPDRLSLTGTLSRTGRAVDGFDGTERLTLPDPGLLGALIPEPPRIPPLDATGHLRASRTATGDIEASLESSRLESTGLESSRLDSPGLAIQGAAWPASTLTLATNPQGHTLRVTDRLAGAPAPWLTWNRTGSGPGRVAITLDGHGLPAGPLALLLTGRRVVTGRLDLTGNLQADAAGAGLDERTLDGPVTARLLDADLDTAILGRALGDVLRVARIPRLPTASGHVACAAAAGLFRSGALDLAHLSAATSFFSLSGSGTINIPGRTLDLRLSPEVRFGGASLATAVTLAGPIDAPNASLQAGSDGRVGFNIGRGQPIGMGACDSTAPGAPPRQKAPKPADILRSLGLLR